MKLAGKDNSSNQGFTFIELMWVATIFLMLSAVLLPMAFGIADSATLNLRDRQNARALATVSLGAQSAGLDLVIPGDLKATIDNLVVGGTPTSGVFKGHYFAVPDLTDEEKVTAAIFLRLANGQLLFEGHD